MKYSRTLEWNLFFIWFYCAVIKMHVNRSANRKPMTQYKFQCKLLCSYATNAAVYVRHDAGLKSLHVCLYSTNTVGMRDNRLNVSINPILRNRRPMRYKFCWRISLTIFKNGFCILYYCVLSLLIFFQLSTWMLCKYLVRKVKKREYYSFWMHRFKI